MKRGADAAFKKVGMFTVRCMSTIPRWPRRACRKKGQYQLLAMKDDVVIGQR